MAAPNQEPSLGLCLGGRLRGVFDATVEQSWLQHVVRSSYTLFFVGDEDELNRSFALPIASFSVQRAGETTPGVKQCTGGVEGREGFNHVFMAKLYWRWPRCLGLLERFERLRRGGRSFEFAAFARPDLLWSAPVPHLAALWHAHRQGRDILTWDDHMAVMRREHAAAFFLGSAHAITSCASVDEWMVACGLLDVPAYRLPGGWPTPNGHRLVVAGGGDGSRNRTQGLSAALYRAEVARVLENRGTPCSPVRLAAAREGVSFCDCGLTHTMGGRCLSLTAAGASVSPAVGSERRGRLRAVPPPPPPPSTVRIAGDRPHPWIGQVCNSHLPPASHLPPSCLPLPAFHLLPPAERTVLLVGRTSPSY